jgi:arylamine N-acetyltransferase
LGPGVSRKEAALVAKVAVPYSEQLAASYDLKRPVELHNVLVNLGMRRGGLCFQMAECMLAELRQLPLRTLELHRGIAWKNDLWNEHNCVVVTAVGAPVESGVVLDAWRNAGRLRWAPVRMDHYPWQPKPAPQNERLASVSLRDNTGRGTTCESADQERLIISRGKWARWHTHSPDVSEVK